MDDTPDKPEEAAVSTASIISLSAVPCSTGGQLILNGSSGFLTASQPLLLNGNSLISSTGAGVIINGLSLGDCQTVTLRPVTASPPLMLNGAQVITKSSMDVQQQHHTASLAEQVSAMEAKTSSLPAALLSTNTTPVSNHPSVISLSLLTKTKSVNEIDYINVHDSEGNSQTVSSSSSSLSPSSPTLPSPSSFPSLVLTQNPQESLALPASMSSAGLVISSTAGPFSSHQREGVVFSSSQLNPSISVVSSSSAIPQVFSLPQVVPSIQGIPVSQLVQHSSGAQVSQCPQLVPVSSLTSTAAQFQSPLTLTTGNRLAQQQQDVSTTRNIFSVSQLNSQLQQQIAHQLGDQTTNSTPIKIHAPHVMSISSPTQIVQVPQSKCTTATQLVPLSMPQLVPVSSIQTSPTFSFPQVVPTSSSLSMPSAGVPLQILTSAPAAGALTQGPMRINQLRPIQSVGPPTSMAPGVQLLNSGIIQLPSAAPGKLNPLDTCKCNIAENIQSTTIEKCLFSFIT